MSAPATKARSRTKKRLLEIKDHLQNLGTVNYALKRLKDLSGKEHATARHLIEKMLALDLIDDYTSPVVLDCLVQNVPALSVVVGRCARGNGLDLVSRCLQDSDRNTGLAHSIISEDRSVWHTFELGRTNYTTAIKRPEDKCIFWTLSIAFFLLYYEAVTEHEFLLPAPVTDKDLTDFFEKYPEFLIRSWDAGDLLQFRLVMKHIVDMYGNGNNKACLVEMVTRITRGREIALTCNTSGGAMKKETIYNDETEVAAECCRVRIYQRESGVEPRRRDQPAGEDERQTAAAKAKAASMPRLTAAQLKRVPTADVRMIAELKDAFEHDSFPTETDAAVRPGTKRFKSAPVGELSSPMGFMPMPTLEKRHSSSGHSSGIDSILAAAGTDELLDVLDVSELGHPDMSRTISEDISSTMRTMGGLPGDDIGSLLYSKPVLTRIASNVSTGSTLSLSRIPSGGLDYMIGETPDKNMRPPKCSRVTSQDWPQYPYNQLK